MSSYILAIDQGTTGTTVSVINEKAQSVARVNHEFPQYFPKPGWVEHDPEEIWKTVTKGIADALKLAGIDGQQIVALGITNQRETVVFWERDTLRPLARAIVWQCRRTTDFCQKLKKDGKESFVRRRTGLVIDPYFSASKMRWLLDHVSGAKLQAKKGAWIFGTIDSFLIARLSGGRAHVTDVSNASRTQLFNIHKGAWDEDLLKIFAVPRASLPEVRSSSGEVAVTRGVPGLPDGIPISGVAGDQQAALFGQGCFKPGMVKCTFGTGSFLLLNCGSEAVSAKSGVLTTVAWQLKGSSKLTYALEGGAFICGAAVQFLRDQMGFVGKSSEVEALASQVDTSDGVEFVPALAGLGAPYWSPDARGMIAGLTRGTTRAHIARATLEAMALQNVDILAAMQKDYGKKIKEVRVDGGASANNLLMQMQADYLGAHVTRPVFIETTVIGAAYLAGLGVGLWQSLDDIEKVWRKDQTFVPKLSIKERNHRLGSWHKAIDRVLL